MDIKRQPSDNSTTTPPSDVLGSTQLAPSSAPTRKQNVACDACRARKVKCLQVPGQSKCQHCILKGSECLHLIQQITSEKRRAVGSRRSKVSPQDALPKLQSGYTPLGTATRRQSHSQPDSKSHYTPDQALFGTTRTRTNQTLQLIDWLFSPPDDGVAVPPFVGGADSVGYRSFMIRSRIAVARPTDADWTDLKQHLQPDDFRTEFANDLVEVYFQICHSRMPLLDPAEFRTRLKAYLYPETALDPTILPLPAALLATVIAWGSRFSEHPLLVMDRSVNSGRSRICRILTKRAREAAEGEKIHRLPSVDNAISALLLEPLQSHNPSDPDGFRGFWLNCGIRHLFELGMNRKARLIELDEQTRGRMTYAWFQACIADAYASVYWRKKPVIEDDDYDFSFMGDPGFLPHDSQLASPESMQSWISSLHMADIARHLARNLSRPDVTTSGIPLRVLETAMKSLREWKEKYLNIVGVPNNFQADWDFVAAVSACTCDAQYHVMWVILHSALEEFQVREAKEGQLSYEVMRDLERQVFEEALQGALRIAGLTSVLTSNGYLRLDPNILHFSTYAAGMFLARNGKPEVKTCIKGLEQYSFAYEEAFEQAKWMQQVYSSVIHHQQLPIQQTLHSPASSIGSSNGHHYAMDTAQDPLGVFVNGAKNERSTFAPDTPYADSSILTPGAEPTAADSSFLSIGFAK
ncbi:hypothetical protein PIIN_04133 [Serendipita indica DSM 11827]|uniref:Zn(2)-C6 fungal-type domain-containing protein n=1 Tax=Serendipita indica (strain DSM 11827) TaxID=1109443 RepID=G4TFX6_SERID|nr:hypothetical protein PIIN_04133 [Serendipita indica DSM 11827]